MEIRPYDLVVFQGTNKDGKEFRVLGFTKSLKENQVFIDEMISQGAPVVDLNDRADSE